MSTLEKREILDLSDIEKSPFEQFNQNYIPGKVHVKIECVIFGQYSVLLINREICENLPSLTLKICLFTVHWHYPGEAPCQIAKYLLNRY